MSDNKVEGASGELPTGIVGFVRRMSRYGPKETLDRISTAITERGMMVLARIDHSEAAATVGMELRPTAVLIFGNPKTGTPLMQRTQTIGIDLPLRALVWEDDKGSTWIGYNEPAWLADRHHADDSGKELAAAMSAALATLVKESAGS